MKILVTEEMRQAFRAEQEREPIVTPVEFLSSIRNVGPDKPLGYLMTDRIVSIGNSTVEEEIERAAQRNLSSKIVVAVRGPFTLEGRQFPGTSSELLIVWDEKALTALLQENSSILKRHNWPLDAEGFATKIPEKIVPLGDLFDLIADAFADHTNTGRTYTHAHAIPSLSDASRPGTNSGCNWEAMAKKPAAPALTNP